MRRPTDPTPEVPCELGVPAARAPPPLSASLSPQPSGPAGLIESEAVLKSCTLWARAYSRGPYKCE